MSPLYVLTMLCCCTYLHCDVWKGALLDNEQQYAALCVCTLLSDPFLSLSFVFVVILTLLFFFCVKDNKIIYFLDSSQNLK